MSLNKFNYSHNNHYKWGFNDGWFNPPEPRGCFQVSIGACSRPHLSFREECINVARLLGQEISKPILVGLSGGFDSQVVCLSLINAGVPFRPVILRLVGNKNELFNEYDIESAFTFCKKLNLDPIVEELNLIEYYCTEAMQLVHDYCITSAEISVQLHLVRKYKDTHAYINGGGDPIILKLEDEVTGKKYLSYSLGPTPIEQYLMDHDIEGCLKFFMYTPELIASYLDNDIFKYYNNAREAILDRSGYDYFTYCIKPMMYTKEWPELILRRKNTGFERFPYMDIVKKQISLLNEHVNPKSKIITWKYEDILDHLLSNTGEVKSWKSLDDRNYY